MNILGKKVTLRAIEEEDLPILHRWANDPEIWYLLDGWHFPVSMASTKRWYASLQDDGFNQRFAVDAPDAGLIGTSNLVNIDWKNNHAFHGMMLGDVDIRGKGYGTDAIMAIMRYAFEELHLERLDGSMIEYNEASLYVYCKKCGWKEEGRLRNWYYRKKRYWDKILVGVTRSDYFELAEKTKYWKSE
ncbi:MAG: GNAT family protein [Thermodesulfobacteriota bacterium]|nr:GNAT family protein [Thermodesulfobacteriota bacterium]